MAKEGENSTFIEEGGEGPKGLPRETLMLIVIGIQVVLAVLGIIGNTLVLYIFGRRRESLTSTLGILTLGVKDMIGSAVIIPYIIGVEAVMYHVKYDFFCKLLHFLIMGHQPFTVFILTAIAVDRCACVCHTFLHVVKFNRGRILVVAILLVTIAIAVPSTLSFGVYMKKSTFLRISSYSAKFNSTFLASARDHGDVVYTGWCHANDIILSYASFHKYVKFYLFLFVAPFVCTGLLYTVIFVFVQHRKWKTQHACPDSRLTSLSAVEVIVETPEGASDDDQKENEEKEGNNREQIHLTLVMFTVTVAFYVVFLPAWLMAHRVLPFNLIVFYLYLVNHVSSPIVYVCMDNSFRDELKNLLHRSWSRVTS